MRKWLHWAWLGACAAAVGVGCGSSGGGQQGFAPTDDGGSSTSSGSSSGTSGSGSSSGSGSGGTSSGDDATTGDDATMSSSSSGSSSGSGSGGPADASLDIAFPDAFYGPDTGSSSGGPQDAASDGPQCFPDGITCQNGVAYTCSNGVQTTTNCGSNQCVNGFGCLVCQPGTGSCSGNVGTACNSSGTGYVTNNCDPLQGESCNPTDGQCTGDCANLGASYIGCEYYAVTMLNHLLDQGTFYFSISVSNTSTKTATVTVTGGALGAALTQTVGAGQLVEIKLPWVQSLSCGTGNTCNGGQPTAPGTEIQAAGAYHIRSTEPVTVYQFNPRDYAIGSTNSYTNDASLLIPTNALTGNYRVAAWPTFYVWPGTIAVIGTQNATSVTVSAPAGSLQAGAGLGTSGGTVTLNQGDVLEIESVLNSGGGQAYGTDISGALVTANKPVQVLGGHSCVYIPATVGYCDHMEEIAFPTETLRGDYLVTVPYNKNGTPQQWVKIVGVAANTHITFDPSSVHAATVLNAGTVLTLQGVTQNFRVYSTDSPQQPFMVAQYMEGQDNFGSNCTTGGATDCGDPSESVAVATGQFRNSYQFVAPTSYAENWVNVIAQNGATVTVDGATVTGYSAIGSSGWSVAHFALPSTNGGVHKASASTGVFGIEVYGYGAYTSYMYPGGLNLTRQ